MCTAKIVGANTSPNNYGWMDTNKRKDKEMEKSTHSGHVLIDETF